MNALESIASLERKLADKDKQISDLEDKVRDLEDQVAFSAADQEMKSHQHNLESADMFAYANGLQELIKHFTGRLRSMGMQVVLGYNYNGRAEALGAWKESRLQSRGHPG